MNNDSIAIYDIADENFSLVASVKLDDEPQGRKIAFSADSQYAYVVTLARKSENARLYEISLSGTPAVVRYMDFSGVSRLSGVAVAGDLVFVSSDEHPVIWVVSRDSWTVTSQISTTSAPATLAMHPDGQHLFALLPDEQAVVAINIESETIVARYSGLEPNASDMEFTADGSKMYISHYTSTGNILVFDVTEQPVILSDDFEDGVIDTNLWVTGGAKRGWSDTQPTGVGDWTFSSSEIMGTDGYLRLRVEGPTSGNTYGAEAWVRTTYDFNDGHGWVINFTWEADVAIPGHYDRFNIQITDGYIPEIGSVHWSRSEIAGTTNLLYGSDDAAGASLTSGLAKTTWSVLIDPSGIARLYDRPDGSGTLLHEGSLDPTLPWYFRLMVTDATSAGFPAGDTRLNLFDFSATRT